MDISPDDEEVRDVYANFGLAMYAAQCLEHGLVNALIYLKLIPLKASVTVSSDWATTVDLFSSEHFEHTLGHLIRDLESVTVLPQDLSEKLSMALKMRNWLAHNYFRERARNFLSTNGRKEMIIELQEAVNTLHGVDEHLTVALDPIRKKYGITEESITRISNEMLNVTLNEDLK